MKKENKIIITKASGERVEFSGEKLRTSMRNAGATDEQVGDIIDEISEKLYQGISTKKIYRMAFARLKERSRNLAARYHLKRAIMELGPSGYPFEKYVAEILKYQGYGIKVGDIIKGHCVYHEIDVIAEKENKYYMVECKYHNQPGIICDVKIPLYIQARFKDVEAQWLKEEIHKTKFHQGWVVTNTRFSSDAMQYGTCSGLYLLGWDYPVKGSLKDLIDTLALYPVTCLTSLTRVEKQRLLDKKIVLCKEICDDEKIFLEIGIKPDRMKIVIEENQQLCNKLVESEKK